MPAENPSPVPPAPILPDPARTSRLARWAHGAESALQGVFHRPHPVPAPPQDAPGPTVPIYPAGDLGEDNQIF